MNAAESGACNRGPCWKESGHEDPCEPGSRLDPRRTTEKDTTVVKFGRCRECSITAEHSHWTDPFSGVADPRHTVRCG